MKKILTALLLACFVCAGAVSVVGCGDPPKPKTGDPKTEPKAEPKKTEPAK